MGMCWHPNPTRNINSVNSKKSWRVCETRAHCHCYRGIGNYSWTSLDFLSCWPAVLSDSSCEAQPCVLPALSSKLKASAAKCTISGNRINNKQHLSVPSEKWMSHGTHGLKRCSQTVRKCFTGCKLQRNEMDSKPWIVMTCRLGITQGVFLKEGLWGWLHLIFLLLTFEKYWPWPGSKVTVLPHPRGPSFSKTNADCLLPRPVAP